MLDELDDKMPPGLRRLQQTIANALVRLEPHFGPNYRLTLVARNNAPEHADGEADVVVSNDDLVNVIDAVKRRRDAVESGGA